MASADLISFISKIYDIGAIKFGAFTLKSGISSPVYIDFRLLVSYPLLMRETCDLLSAVIDRELAGKFDRICGVPLAALPICSVISTSNMFSMIMCRQHVKSHGTSKKIEGHFEKGDRCVVVEDIVTSGGSVLETVSALREAGLAVSDTLVLLDRQQGAVHNLTKHGITVHSLLSIDLILDCIQESKKVSEEEIGRVRKSLQSATPSLPALNAHVKKSLLHRVGDLTHPVARRLADIVREKQTNLVLSADVSTCAEILQLSAELGDYICMLKLHSDSLTDIHSSPAFLQELQASAAKHRFLLLEDRKLADIGYTVSHQYERLGWADLVTVHTIAGPGCVKAIRNVLISTESLDKRGCLLVAEMSSEGNLISSEYTKATVDIAREYSDCVVGLICQNGCDKPDSLLCLTPGIRIGDVHGDSLAQTYIDPNIAVRERGTDLLIVGRGILQAPDRIEAAKLYNRVGYQALSGTDPLP